MAKRSKAKKDGGGAVKPSQVIKVPSAGVLKRLIASKRSTLADVASLNGTFGQEMKNAVKDHNVDKLAFGVYARFDKLEPPRLKTVMAHLAHYFEAGGLNKRADSVIEMDLDDDDEGDEEATNVTKFPDQPAA